ncbi:PREDICTED: C-factor-like [Sturnus vulgaris]|uniref:C-factor-like n=1 Tax=Sturnus vulgaris TaxID=9172 RepID=UPI00071A4023|nr:PREDICTED: C-factor-like [Sturnus vulgaris]
MEGLSVGSVLLTGCDGGLGLGLLKGLLEQPNPPRNIFAACLDPQGKAVNEVALGFPNVMILPLDVTDPNSIKAAVRKVQEELGSAGLNLLINNTSTTRRSTLATETAENMSLVYTTNTIGPLQTSQAFLPLLKKAAEAEGQREISCSRAAIINISSILGSIEIAEAWEERQDICYRCSKAALNMLTKCLALEYGSSGILCVSVDPGHVTPPLEQGMGPVTLEESVRGVLQLLTQLSATSNGTFWDWRGQRLPWNHHQARREEEKEEEKEDIPPLMLQWTLSLSHKYTN